MHRLLASLSCAVSVTLASPIALADADASRFTFYDMPTPLAGPCDLANGPDGLLWGEDILTNNIFTINTTTGKVTEYPIPYTEPALPITALPGFNETEQRGAFACAIRPGADGNMWASSGLRNQLVKIDPSSKKMTVITPTPYNPLGNLQPFNDLYTDAEGMYFTQTTGNVVSYYEYATGKISNFVPPTPESGPLGMFVGSDGLAYFAEFFAQKIGRLNRHTGKIDEFPITDPALLTPSVIRVERDGKIYFTAMVGNSIGSLDMHTGEFAAFQNNYPLTFPTEDTISPDGRIWFSALPDNFINVLDPSTGKITNIEVPGSVTAYPVGVPFPFQIAMNYMDGAVYFANVLTNQVGRYQI